jgi:catechol 2,3-dioxygenase-like lactoylglutathione lyase family enzyme
MKVFGAATVFQVSDLEASLNYYRDVLGFEKVFLFGAYAGIHSGEFCLHLCARTNLETRMRRRRSRGLCRRS